MNFILAIVAIFIAYLFGSIPMGYLGARLYGVDVTASGSGRTGGTNVLRSVGPLAAALTVLGDILKGLIPVYLLATVAPPLVTALSAAATVLGHNYSIFLRFRGGVGAGTAMGALGGLTLPGSLVVAVIALVALGISRYASILSTTIALMTLVVLIILAGFGAVPYAYVIFGVLNLLIIFNALRPNFTRLRAGTERKIGQKPENIIRVSPHQ